VRNPHLAFSLTVTLLLAGCSMTEEVKRIEEVKKAQQRQAQSQSSDLTGSQIFIRSCNTCHPSGRKGYGPTLENLNKDFPETAEGDQALRKLIRSGRGMMPPQTKDILDDKELDNLIGYLRQLNS
jgi:mono/diheme cytochrome c family protein